MNTPNPEKTIMDKLFSLAKASEQYNGIENLMNSGTRFITDSTGSTYAAINTTQEPGKYNLSITSGKNGKPDARLKPLYSAVKVDITGISEITSTGDITDKVMAAMTGEAADSVVDSLANIYESARHSENPEELFNNILDTMRAIDTTAPEKQIDPTALSPRLNTLYENLEALRQCPKHIDNTLNTMHAHYNKTHAPKGSIFQIAEERYKITHPVPEEMDTGYMDTPARKTIYQRIKNIPRTIKEIPGKIKQNYQQIITIGAFGIAVGSAALMMGCIDKKPEDVQKEVNTHIYVDMGQEGDPEKQIHDFYDLALQEAGDPVIKPLAQYAAEYELDPETGHIIPDTLKIYDPNGNPVSQEAALAMQDNIARDDTGNIITDAAQLDIHIEEIGKNKYQIHNLKQELQVEDGIWRVKDTENDSFDKNLVDNIMKVGDGKDDIYGAIVLDDSGNPKGAIFVDEDTFELYKGDFALHRYENAESVNQEECIYLGNGIYVYLFDLSEIPENLVCIYSPKPFTQERVSIADKKNNGKYAQFEFVKETN